uniref:SAYSvFN domain-containing protein n=1 Tax=Onchocerca volvulus TaxID=6282 RepID=A0A8R1XZF9_ONCVO
MEDFHDVAAFPSVTIDCSWMGVEGWFLILLVVSNHDAIYEEKFRSSNSVAFHSAIVSKLKNILLKPIQLWSYFYCHWPRSCTVFAISLWIIVQWYFTFIEFGLVFFISSLFFVLFINLGNRKSNELSAYSVFNPHCERLPGTLTAEHFERDLLKREVLHQ